MFDLIIGICFSIPLGMLALNAANEVGERLGRAKRERVYMKVHTKRI